MPRVVALQQGSTSIVDLGHFACRFDIGVSMMRDVPAFSLVFRYPPNTPALMRPDGLVVSMAATAMMSLARVAIPLAENAEALQRVTEVSLDGDTADACVARMTEAYQLFRNSPRTRVEALEGCIKDSVEVVRAYWILREWIADGMSENKKVNVLTTTLVFQP